MKRAQKKKKEDINYSKDFVLLQPQKLLIQLLTMNHMKSLLMTFLPQFPPINLL
jgi:hypothetical protein